LPRWQSRSYQINVSDIDKAVKVETVVRYHLLNENRRNRISYKNKTPIAYDIFRQIFSLR